MPGRIASSGLTAITTSSAAAVVAISSANMPPNATNVSIVNEGVVSGFFSLDGGTTWERMPAGAMGVAKTITREYEAPMHSVQFKRDGASDLAGVYVSVW